MLKPRGILTAVSFACLFVLCSVFSQMSFAQSGDKTEKPDLSKQPTLYVVGYAHLDTEWRWEYPQVIDEYIRKTMEDNFVLFDKYPHYVFNFSGANRYRFMKEYFPADFARVKHYVDEGQWFPAGSSMEEGDVNAPSAEAIIRQVLYGNEWFRKEFGKASEEYMLPDCFGFPASLPTILAHSGVKGFSTQKLTWGSSAYAGGPESLEKTPEGTPFNVGVWVGPDGESVLAGLNPGGYGSTIDTDLSKPLPALPANPAIAETEKQFEELRQRFEKAQQSGQAFPQADFQRGMALQSEAGALRKIQSDRDRQRYQDDWAARVEQNGKVTGVFTDYHYYGTGDIGGTPQEDSIKRLEAIVTKGTSELPPEGEYFFRGMKRPERPAVQVGNGPVQVISATADQMFRDITPAEAARLPRYTGEMELTNHSAGSLTSQAYQKRWLRKEELLADAAEKASIAAQWLGARPYPQQRLNDAWTLVMGGHFHDIAAGTATPKAYEFAWNDDVIAMNQFAGVFTDATSAVAAALDTETTGVPLVVFNNLNIAREDVVEAKVNFPGGMPDSVHVISPDRKDIPAQMSDGKVVFVAKVPSAGYAVYDVVPGASTDSALKVSESSLENEYYRVQINAEGDVSSIFDKTIGKELLAAPARLAISYDNPEQWPAWNMDWEQEQAAPRQYVGGPAKIRIVENGPARLAVEITRDTAGSHFVQTIRLAAGDAGKRVEIGNVIDWNTKESNLKATFPLTASNQFATYNWDIGTVQRPTADPKKFEVPSHQWIDLTDASGEFGATILTDCKNGSDKPDDHTIRLTLIRTPGVRGGYTDQGTQDIGHHEFIYGIAGHTDDWRHDQTNWQAERLNDPLIAFTTEKHEGALGKEVSLLKTSSDRVRVLALKKAEESDEVIVRLVELEGKPQGDVRISFAAPVVSAREVNGQEQPVGSVTVANGVLVASFGAYQPRTFAVKLAAPQSAQGTGVRSEPVKLRYNLAASSADGTPSNGGFDSKGNSLPAEMLPEQIAFDDVSFQLAPAKTGVPDALVPRGQTIALPRGNYNRVYVLAASAEGDQRATFEAGNKKLELDIQNWGGFIGQWDDRLWTERDVTVPARAGRNARTRHDDYAVMVGIVPGYIKRADLAWYSSHHHNNSGANVAYEYSYLFAYSIDLPQGAKTLKLPNNDKVRILAVSVAAETPEVVPAQPLYDSLSQPNATPGEFSLATATSNLSLTQGARGVATIVAIPRKALDGGVSLKASGLPAGVTASFDTTDRVGISKLMFTASNSAKAGNSTVTVTGRSGSISHSVTLGLTISAVKKGAVAVDLSPAYNVSGIHSDHSKFDRAASLDGEGWAYSAELVGTSQMWDGISFKLGPANVPDAVTSETVDLPGGKFASLSMLGVGVEGSQEAQTFAINYADGTSSMLQQSVSDWYTPADFAGESVAVAMPYRLVADGEEDDRTFHIYGYRFALDPNKVVRSVTLPNNRYVVVFAMSLVPAQ
jgi:alpha-mannosidase